MFVLAGMFCIRCQVFGLGRKFLRSSLLDCWLVWSGFCLFDEVSALGLNCLCFIGLFCFLADFLYLKYFCFWLACFVIGVRFLAWGAKLLCKVVLRFASVVCFDQTVGSELSCCFLVGMFCFWMD